MQIFMRIGDPIDSLHNHDEALLLLLAGIALWPFHEMQLLIGTLAKFAVLPE